MPWTYLRHGGGDVGWSRHFGQDVLTGSAFVGGYHGNCFSLFHAGCDVLCFYKDTAIAAQATFFVLPTTPPITVFEHLGGVSDRFGAGHAQGASGGYAAGGQGEKRQRAVHRHQPPPGDAREREVSEVVQRMPAEYAVMYACMPYASRALRLTTSLFSAMHSQRYQGFRRA